MASALSTAAPAASILPRIGCDRRSMRGMEAILPLVFSHLTFKGAPGRSGSNARNIRTF
jgi:hypothetical protein